MIAQPAPPSTTQSMPMAGRAWSLLMLRLGMVLVISLLIWVILRSAGGISAFPPDTIWATLGLLPVNIVCLLLVARFYRHQGLSLRAAMGVQHGRIVKDIGWGLLWLIVLNVPFALAVSGTVWLMYGTQAPEAFGTIFVNPAAQAPLSPTWLLLIGLIAVIPFIVLNAPVEELVFRGYGLNGLQTGLGRVGAIMTTSLLFGAQHIFFAATVPGMLVYFVAFTVWGGIAAIIVTKQGRLLPIIIAHWMINVMLSAPALVLPILMLAGVVT